MKARFSGWMLAASLSVLVVGSSRDATAGDNWLLSPPTLPGLPKINLVPAWLKLPPPPTPAKIWGDMQRNTRYVVNTTGKFLVPWAYSTPQPIRLRPPTGSRGFTNIQELPKEPTSYFGLPSWLRSTEPLRPSGSVQDFLGQRRVK
jgi:hypothetical protein